MTKRLALIILSSFTFVITYAQENSTYELQRKKINAMLAERSARFGQYDQSLNARTGIFGLQTKKDIKNSNEILRQIILKDNNIFTELKVLLDYKDLQFQEVKTNVNHNQQRIEGYKKTIRDLQRTNEELLNYNNSINKQLSRSQLFLTLFVIATVTFAMLMYRNYKLNKVKSDKSSIKILN